MTVVFSSPADTACKTTPVALETGKRVLHTEVAALREMADTLGTSFVAILDLLSAVTGKVVVTGMGKSGHIAAKIAATLASTGTPAFFVHPAEASHGDLGMVTRQDAILALSNSGETPELADMIAYARRSAIPLIGITSKARSTLAEESDAAFVLPMFDEACPHGLAPTTSTTLMMALGDALAVALLERKGFTVDDFRVFHPGGKLGQKLLRVSDVMHGSVALPLCAPDTPMSEALVIMTGKSFGCVGIVDASGVLVGMVTDGDLRRHMDDLFMQKKAGTVMTANPLTLSPLILAEEALLRMNTRAITGIFVVDSSCHPVGFLHIHDLLRSGIA